MKKKLGFWQWFVYKMARLPSWFIQQVKNVLETMREDAFGQTMIFGIMAFLFGFAFLPIVIWHGDLLFIVLGVIFTVFSTTVSLHGWYRMETEDC